MRNNVTQTCYEGHTKVTGEGERRERCTEKNLTKAPLESVELEISSYSVVDYLLNDVHSILIPRSPDKAARALSTGEEICISALANPECLGPMHIGLAFSASSPSGEAPIAHIARLSGAQRASNGISVWLCDMIRGRSR